MNKETIKRVIEINSEIEKVNIAMTWANKDGSFAYVPKFPTTIIRVPEKLNEKITDILIQYREELEKELESL